MRTLIKDGVRRFVNSSKSSKVRIVCRNDVDGVTSASIISKALSRDGIPFTLNFTSSLSKDFVSTISPDSIILLIGLGSGNLELLSDFKEVFVIDYRQVNNSSNNTFFINPLVVNNKEVFSSSMISYFFVKEMNGNNIDLASLAVVGSSSMPAGNDSFQKELFIDSAVCVKKGLLLCPSNRPIDKALEFSTNIFIPGVTGSHLGVLDLLEEANIVKNNSHFKSFIDLDDDEVSRLITSIIIRRPNYDNSKLVGDFYLVKLLGKLEDAGELALIISACCHYGFSHLALALCLNNKSARIEAEKLYINYRQEVLTSIVLANSSDRIIGQDYAILNVDRGFSDLMINNVFSSLDIKIKDGSLIIFMSRQYDKINVFLMTTGNLVSSRRVDEFVSSMMESFSPNWSANAISAHCSINLSDGERFVSTIKKMLDIQVLQI